MRGLAIVMLLTACEKSAPAPEVRIGGPYRQALTRVDDGATERARGQEVDRFARGEAVHFALQYRAVYERTLETVLVDATGKRCWSETKTFGDEAFRTNPKGWGMETVPLPRGFEQPCADGAFPDFAFRPGRYTLRVTLDGARVGERSFDVR